MKDFNDRYDSIRADAMNSAVVSGGMSIQGMWELMKLNVLMILHCNQGNVTNSLMKAVN